MLVKLRSHLTFANVIAMLALFVALGGSSYAALRVTGKNVRNGSLTGTDVRNSSLTGRDVRSSSLGTSDVKNRSLLAKDFKAGQLPQGPPGPQGPAGQAATRLFALVDGDNGALVRASGVIASEKINTGAYYLTFDRNIDSCVFLASPSSKDSLNPESRYVGAARLDSTRAFVVVTDNNGQNPADFAIAAFC